MEEVLKHQIDDLNSQTDENATAIATTKVKNATTLTIKSATSDSTTKTISRDSGVQIEVKENQNGNKRKGNKQKIKLIFEVFKCFVKEIK